MTSPTMTPEALRDWMHQTLEDDLKGLIPKAMEYGATDLEAMGATLMPNGSVQDGMEAACQFYLLGKAARAAAAYQEGRVASDDTLKDETVYSLMTRAIRHFGHWRIDRSGLAVPMPEDTHGDR